jgi:cysteine synthase A
MGDQSIVVTVLPDSNKKYLSTDLMKTEKLASGALSSKVELLDFSPVQRAFEA